MVAFRLFPTTHASRSRCLLAVLIIGVIAVGGLLSEVTVAGERSTDSPWQIPRAKYPWFDVAFDEEHTTGTCVGRLISPRCAIETTFACLIRGGELCRRVLLGAASVEFFEEKHYPDRLTRYRIARTRNTRPKIWPDTHDYPEYEETWRKGDLAVIVNNSSCRLPGPVCPSAPPSTTVFVLRRVAGEWRVGEWEALPSGPGLDPAMFLD